MPSAFPRLRLWFGFLALLLIAVVAGFYFYARYRVDRALHELPAKLGADIQQNTQGFTYSQSAGGRTIYSISASNATRYKQGGKAELHDVKIISYGRDSDRLDQISGDKFEYDAASGQVVAQDRVFIQLQAAAAGTSKPGGKPTVIGSPLNLETSGLTFGQKTGIAQTAKLITFELPQGTGSAQGAIYDSKNNTLELQSDIRLTTQGPKPMNLQARHALYLQRSDELNLTGVLVQSGVRREMAEHLLLHLREDNTVERADASAGIQAKFTGARPAELHSNNGVFIFGTNNQLRSGELSGGVTWTVGGAASSSGSAGRISLQFGHANQIRAAQLHDKVEIRQASATATSSQGTEFRGDELDLNVRDGRFLQTANSVGAAEIVLASAADGKSNPSAGKTVIDSSRFDAEFSRNNRISTLKGSSPVKIVSSNPGNPDRVSTSDDLLATFTGDKNLSLQDAVQTGNVQIQDGQRTAFSDRATFNQAKNTLTLTGNVRFKDPETGAYLTTKSLSLNRQSGETVAMGAVKTSYSDQKMPISGQKTPVSGAILAPSQTIHVTAPQMVASNSAGTARYSGGARLWQEGNIIEAPVIDLARNQRILDAAGQGKGRVATVFVQNGGQNRQQTPVEVTADHLHYDDNQRKAAFDGGIVVHSGDSILHADHAVILLKPPTQRPAGSPGTPSEVQTITATGNILIQQPIRKATGTRLLYTADDEKFVLTGTPATPPSIFDAEHGHVTGVSLTFYTHDDTVLVDSSNSGTISTSRVKK